MHCQWEAKTVIQRTDHLPSYVESKKMMSLTLHTHGCPRASLRVSWYHLLFFLYPVDATPPGEVF